MLEVWMVTPNGDGWILLKMPCTTTSMFHVGLYCIHRSARASLHGFIPWMAPDPSKGASLHRSSDTGLKTRGLRDRATACSVSWAREPLARCARQWNYAANGRLQ
mmetsp:Transcript_19936/g.46721  ORF Transcript_19936/g.46721 Transcript_19936/m.46721 type:complete len:105 (-) Transcript_19936:1064-1378(-)